LGALIERWNMKQQRFWEIDLVELVKTWVSDIGVFLLTALTFVGLAIPVIIPTLILWYLYTIDFNVRP
jgi:hypothetical protein